jgi:hypothetical protein
MRLVRRTPPDHGQEVDRYSTHGKEQLQAIIEKFGTGISNFNMFLVEIDWDDVETIIQEFANAENPGALRLQKAIKLLAAVEESVK